MSKGTETQKLNPPPYFTPKKTFDPFADLFPSTHDPSTRKYFASFLVSSLDQSLYDLNYPFTRRSVEEHRASMEAFEGQAKDIMARNNLTSLLDIMVKSAIEYVRARALLLCTLALG